MKLALMGLVIVIMAFLTLPVHAMVTSGTLSDLGYTAYSITGNTSIVGPESFGSSAYNVVSQTGMITSYVQFSTPWDTPTTLYFNFQLSDGSSHKGVYQYLGSDQYTLTLDGATVSGQYEYTLVDELQQMAGLWKYDTIAIAYAQNLADTSEYAIYVESWGDIMQTPTPCILLPIQSAGDDITSFSAMSTTSSMIKYYESSQPDFVNPHDPIDDNDPVGNLVNVITNNKYIKNLTDGVDMLLSLVGFVFPLVSLILMILGFLINPLNDVLLIMQYILLTAIIALSDPGDILDSMRKWARFMASGLTFSIYVLKGLVQVASLFVQAIALAISAGAGVANVAASAGKDLLGWAITGLFLLVK